MDKQTHIKRKAESQSGHTITQYEEQYLTISESPLPPASELKALKEVDPRLIDYLLEKAKEEQALRHATARDSLELIRSSNRLEFHLQRIGMLGAFLSVLLFVGLAALALWLDKAWVAGVLIALCVASVVSSFVRSK
ncbi:MAG: hypothetical protein Q4A61_00870 [Porphyromonadaceae bacterium]|nr:hypothetical protein [Porphyromonadaceae bacterium]